MLLNNFIMEISKREPNVGKVDKIPKEWSAEGAKNRQHVHTATLLYNQHHHDPRVERENAVDIFLEKNKRLRYEFIAATNATRNERMMEWLNHNANIPKLIYDKPSKVFTIDP
jgi:thioesterase domain-containing protein